MIRTITLAAVLLALGAPLSAAPRDRAEYKAVEEKNLVSGKHKLDPAKAYIFIRSPMRSSGAFLKVPDAAEVADYEAEWREELADARKDYPGKLARWQAKVAAKTKAGDKPVEPTEENFAIAPIEQRMIVSFGPQFVYSKSADGADAKFFTYLIEVEPGEYSYFGPLMVMPNGQTFGTCYCMGSVRFEAKKGEITSLGDFLSLGWADREMLSQSTIERANLPEREAKPTDWSVPDSLSALPAAPARLRAAGKVNNFIRALVGRIPPVPGVLAYDRDIPIDLAGIAEKQAAARAAAEQAAAEAADAAVASNSAGEQDSPAGEVAPQD